MIFEVMLLGRVEELEKKVKEFEEKIDKIEKKLEGTKDDA